MRGASSVVIGCTLAVCLACGSLLGIDDEPPVAAVVAPSDGGGSSDVAQAEGSTPGLCENRDLSSDNANCGACGHDCRGGTCTKGDCAPQLMAKISGGEADRLLLHGDSLFVRAGPLGGSRRPYRVALAPPHGVVDLDPSITAPETATGELAALGNVLYWGTPNGLRSRVLDAPSSTTLLDAGADAVTVRGVRIAGSTLYWTRYMPYSAGGRVASCTLPACADPQFRSYAHYASDLVVAGARTFEMATPLDPLDGVLSLHETHTVPLTGEELGGEVARLLHDGGDQIYWSTSKSLRRFTISTSTVADLLTIPTHPADRIAGIALDGDGALYLAQQFYVRRCVVTAGKCVSSQVALLDLKVTDVALDADFVYILAREGSIWRKRR